MSSPVPSKFVFYLIALFYLLCGSLAIEAGHLNQTLLTTLLGCLSILGAIGALLKRKWLASVILAPSLYVAALVVRIIIEPLIEETSITMVGSAFYLVILVGTICCPYLVLRYVSHEHGIVESDSR